MFWRELTSLQGNFPLSTNSPLLWDLILSTDHTAGKEFEQQTELGLQNFISPEGKEENFQRDQKSCICLSPN